VFDLGSPYPAALDVYNAAGQKTNPDTATLVITLPDQTTVTPPVTLPPAVTGELRYLFPTTQPGRHLVNWTITNPSKAYSDVFDVMEAAPPAIISLADAKQTLSINPDYTDDDDELRAKLRGVTTGIERYMRTVYAYRQVTETFQRPVMGIPWAASSALRLTFVPVIKLTGLVTVSPQNVVTTTYDPVNNMWTDPESGLVHVYAGPPLAGRLQATYTAGMTIIPNNVLEGARVLLQAVWETRRGPGGLNGVIGPEEMADYRHYTALPRKCVEWLGPPRPVVY
jgi:hypothetical protein